MEIRGVPIRTYKGTPPSLRAILDMGRAFGEKEFIVYEGERPTYENHYRAAMAFGRVLSEKYGVKKGDRVALVMRNFPEWSVVCHLYTPPSPRDRQKLRTSSSARKK